MDIGYARVSTVKQGLDRQIDTLRQECIDDRYIYIDKKSGSTTNRPDLKKALEHAREGDVIVVHTLDRLGGTVRPRHTETFSPLRVSYSVVSEIKRGVRKIPLRGFFSAQAPPKRSFLTVYRQLEAIDGLLYTFPMVESKDLVVSFARGVEIIRVLAEEDRALSLAEIATRIDTSRATTRRLLITLQKQGYVLSNGPTFELRPKVMELGDRYIAGLKFPALARPYLEELAATVRDTCSLTILDHDEIVYVDRVKAARLMTVGIAVGTRLPAYQLSSGRVLLGAFPEDERLERITEIRASYGESVPANLEELSLQAHRDGYSATDKELNPALRSIAAPVIGPDGRALAAVNVATPVSRTSMDQLREVVLPELRKATRKIGAALASD